MTNCLTHSEQSQPHKFISLQYDSLNFESVQRCTYAVQRGDNKTSAKMNGIVGHNFAEIDLIGFVGRGERN